VPNREWEAVARSGATGAGRREADSRKEGTRASNDASSFFCLTFILFRSRYLGKHKLPPSVKKKQEEREYAL
jgi:hypothetical protein